MNRFTENVVNNNLRRLPSNIMRTHNFVKYQRYVEIERCKRRLDFDDYVPGKVIKLNENDDVCTARNADNLKPIKNFYGKAKPKPAVIEKTVPPITLRRVKSKKTWRVVKKK